MLSKTASPCGCIQCMECHVFGMNTLKALKDSEHMCGLFLDKNLIPFCFLRPDPGQGKICMDAVLSSCTHLFPSLQILCHFKVNIGYIVTEKYLVYIFVRNSRRHIVISVSVFPSVCNNPHVLVIETRVDL